MARLAVVTAVNAWLAANWTATPIVKMNDSESKPPALGAQYIQATYPLANEEQVSIGAPGNNRWRETGAFQIKVYGKRGSGLSDTLTKADALAALFRGQRIAADMQCNEASTAVLQDDNDQGNYFVAGVIVNYNHDLLG